MTRDRALPASSRTPDDPPPRLPADAQSSGPLPSTVGPPAPRASLALVAGFGTLVACLVVLGSLAERIRDHERFVMDLVANRLLHSYSTPALDGLMNLFTTVASTNFVVPLFLVAVAVLAFVRRPGSALFLAVCAIGALLINEVMKLWFHRPRPALPWAHVLPDYSFPSGHTMNGLALYLGLAVVAWSVFGAGVGRIAVVAAIALDIAVAVSRVYLGYHYVTDVLGGFLAGLSWVLITMAVFRWREAGPFRVRTRPTTSGTRPGRHAAGGQT